MHPELQKLDKVRTIQDRLTFEQWMERVSKKYPGSKLDVHGITASVVYQGKQVATWNDDTKKFWIRD